jgi:hypothetical protein
VRSIAGPAWAVGAYRRRARPGALGPVAYRRPADPAAVVGSVTADLPAGRAAGGGGGRPLLCGLFEWNMTGARCGAETGDRLELVDKGKGRVFGDVAAGSERFLHHDFDGIANWTTP